MVIQFMDPTTSTVSFGCVLNMISAMEDSSRMVPTATYRRTRTHTWSGVGAQLPTKNMTTLALLTPVLADLMCALAVERRQLAGKRTQKVDSKTELALLSAIVTIPTGAEVLGDPDNAPTLIRSCARSLLPQHYLLCYSDI